MANYYFDTSAILKLYLDEEGSEYVHRLIAESDDDTFIVSTLTILESRSAIRRRQREGSVSEENAAYAIARIKEHTGERILALPISQETMDEAARLVDRHTLRSLDALQLAACLLAHNGRYHPIADFVCADRRLFNAAHIEGLTTRNPLDAP